MTTSQTLVDSPLLLVHNRRLIKDTWFSDHSHMQLTPTSIHKSAHKTVWIKSDFGGVSGYGVCQRCGMLPPAHWNNDHICHILTATYLSKPDLSKDHAQLCSAKQREEAIDYTKQKILQFLADTKHINVPMKYMSGDGSISNQAYASLIANNQIEIKLLMSSEVDELFPSLQQCYKLV